MSLNATEASSRNKTSLRNDELLSNRTRPIAFSEEGLLRLLILLSTVLFLVSCQKKNEGSGVVSLTFPAANRSSSKVGALAVDFAKVCYLANVTGGIVAGTKKSECDIPFGIHTAFQAPESAATLTIPRGTGYSLEIFAYSRTSASEACPTLTGDSLTGINLFKLSLVGKTNFNVDAAEVSVTVNVTDPGATVASQFTMPAVCTAAFQESGGPILVSTGGLRFYRAVDSSDGVKRISTTNGFGMVLGKDGSR